jgi:LmbE family N-acetylglucosaminyl deacetylase
MAYTPLPDSDIERVLVVNAHPDDADFGAGATVAHWASMGIEVHYLLLTNGDQGGFDDTPRDQMGPLRQTEQRAAGEILGVKSFTFLGHRDGHLVPSIEKRGEVVKAIREIRPQRMLIQSPERNWERIYASHPDHLAAGEIAIQAVYPDARNEFAFPELLKAGLQPWTVDEVWLMAHPVRTHYVDTTDFIEQKISALKAHKSQTRHMDLDEMIRSWGGFIAQEAGFADDRTAEGFFIVGTR